MNYKNLTENQKVLFNKIEELFINHNSITVKDFVTVLFVLGNKFKIKKEVN